MTKHLIPIVAGLAAIYGCGFLLDYLDLLHAPMWYGFPTFVILLTMFPVGIGAIVYGIVSIEEWFSDR